MQVFDRAAEEAAGDSEDVHHEGQHNEYLCHGTFYSLSTLFLILTAM